jgi:hypothetical protein
MGLNSPLGPPPVLLADFWAAGRARNPLDFGGAYQSAWSLYIVFGHTPRRRRPAGLEQAF